jgi:hypothetical protein
LLFLVLIKVRVRETVWAKNENSDSPRKEKETSFSMRQQDRRTSFHLVDDSRVLFDRTRMTWVASCDRTASTPEVLL